jgi:hypothetical protein
MKTVAFVFGRFNPPTIGHGKLLDALKATAQLNRADYYVFTSHSQDAKKNPLSKNTIFKYMAMMFPSFKTAFKKKYGKGEIRTAFDVATAFHGEYDKLIMVVGSDRVTEFESILNRYNGVKAKHGLYNFKEIQIVSAGDRDPDSDGVTGMSASKMRAAAVKGDFDSFRLGVPIVMSDKDTKNMMNAVRKGLKLDVIRERMLARRGLQQKVMIEKEEIIQPVELTWQGYTTTNISTSKGAYLLFDEIVNSISESTYTKADMGYLKEALVLVDKCLTIAETPDELVEEDDVQDYFNASQKAIKLLESVGKRLGIPFDYSFLNELQVKVINENEKPNKSFSGFIGEMYGV